MRLWSQADLNYMRSVQNANMPDTCVVQRVTRTKNGEGGYTDAWTTVSSNPGRLWISSGTSGTSEEARMWGDKESNFTEAFVIMPWDVDVTAKDRIVWTNTETGVTRTFRIVGTNKYDTIVTATRCRVEGTRENAE